MELTPMKWGRVFRRKTIIISLLIAAVLSVGAIIFADLAIKNESKQYLFSEVGQTPANKVALVLGTAKFLADGRENLYYRYRIEAAIELYKAGKVNCIVASGDNSRSTYDEPSQMKEDLILGGVPNAAIYLDYAGFRTLDSIVRMREIFSQSEFTVVSQQFHNERAVFLARRKGIKAIAFNARDVGRYSGLKTNVREKLARVKVFVDFITNAQPRFLGEKIAIK